MRKKKIYAFSELDVSYATQYIFKSITVKIFLESYFYCINEVWNLDRKTSAVEI